MTGRSLAGFAALAAWMLVACSSGGNVDIGSGQSPDPVAADFPMAYIKRTLPLEQDDLRQQRDAVPDPDIAVYVRDRADPTAPELNITERVTGEDLYDIRDLDASYDGTRLVFAMRGPLDENQDQEDPPTWDIWEYEIATDTLRRVIASDIIAGEGHDVSPHYLPDGRIVFASTRQRQSKAVLLDESKTQFEAQTESRAEPAFVLHVMSDDGTGIHQISFNPDHDLDPTVRMNGKVMWSRWDNPPGGRNAIHLYQANPDGTDLELLYGAQSHLTGSNDSRIEFVEAREMPNGEVLVLVRPFTDTDFGGDLYLIDVDTYVENTQPLAANAGLQGPAQRRATGNDIRTIEGVSPGGRFHDAFPLWDGTNRLLVSWSQCLAVLDGRERPCTEDVVTNPAALPAQPAYSLWIYDLDENAFLPLMTPERGVLVSDVVVAQPRPVPAVIVDRTAGVDLDATLVGEGVGILDIRSVYDFDGVDRAPGGIDALADPSITPATARPARFLRIEKMVSIPDDDVLDLDNAAFGVTNYMREILGYVPIEPDGSVRVKVPANVAFQISVLDANGRRLSAGAPAFPVHRNWLQLLPGEVRTCNGCHVRDAQTPTSHGRSGAFPSAWDGAAANSFPNTSTTFRDNTRSGDTMAQARARYSCIAESCASITPSVNVAYSDVWSDPAPVPDDAFSYSYAALNTPAPLSGDCDNTRWTATCRIVINYEQHIHPLWSVARQEIDPVTMAVLSDHTCAQAGCHNPVSALGAPQIPAGQLDLTDGASQDEPLQFNAYRELVAADNEVCIVDGALQDPCLFDTGEVDPVTGLPILSPRTTPRPMTPGNALGSTQFFARFAGGTHDGYLSAAELRLLSEWLDIGAQYYNNPFDPNAPVN